MIRSISYEKVNNFLETALDAIFINIDKYTLGNRTRMATAMS
jgi:hypothetical protein